MAPATCYGLAERRPVESGVPVDNVAGSVMRDTLEHFLSGTVPTRQRNERVPRVVRATARDSDQGTVFLQVAERRSSGTALRGFSRRRLERGRFKLPKVEQGATRIELDAVQLSMLLDGIDFGRVRRPELWQPPQ